MTHRFFVARQVLHGDRVVVPGDIAHQIRDVLRMQPGDQVVLLDNTGWAYRVELETVERGAAQGRVTERWQPQTESRTRLTLYQGVLKGDKFDWVLQKGTELGIAAFVPLLSSRSIAGGKEISAARFERWRRIVTEAAEQSGRAVLPTLSDAVPFAAACRSAAAQALSLIPWEAEPTRRLRDALSGQTALEQVNVFVGPEGGFAAEEIELARQAGLVPVTLGPRILRAETAGLAAAAAILYQLGDFG